MKYNGKIRRIFRGNCDDNIDYYFDGITNTIIMEWMFGPGN